MLLRIEYKRTAKGKLEFLTYIAKLNSKKKQKHIIYLYKNILNFSISYIY